MKGRVRRLCAGTGGVHGHNMCGHSSRQRRLDTLPALAILFAWHTFPTHMVTPAPATSLILGVPDLATQPTHLWLSRLESGVVLDWTEVNYTALSYPRRPPVQ
jgi:hypothetical protein